MPSLGPGFRLVVDLDKKTKDEHTIPCHWSAPPLHHNKHNVQNLNAAMVVKSCGLSSPITCKTNRADADKLCSCTDAASVIVHKLFFFCGVWDGCHWSPPKFYQTTKASTLHTFQILGN